MNYRKCGDCLFYGTTGLRQGDCRRNPPQMAFIGTPQGVTQLTAYPVRKSDDHSCGEFAASKPPGLLAAVPRQDNVL